jgi:hypothetical protein
VSDTSSRAKAVCKIGFKLLQINCSCQFERQKSLVSQIKSLPFSREAFLGEGVRACGPVRRSYLGGSWPCGAAAGEVELEASCSRSFFSRLTSTRPPLVRLALPF